MLADSTKIFYCFICEGDGPLPGRAAATAAGDEPGTCGAVGCSSASDYAAHAGDAKMGKAYVGRKMGERRERVMHERKKGTVVLSF